MGEILTFTVAGSPQTVSRAIEEYARGEGRVTAIVVPWESDRNTLSMAVTAVKKDGWAIEHTNLGTIRLTDAGDERTTLAITAEPPDHPERTADRRIRAVHAPGPDSVSRPGMIVRRAITARRNRHQQWWPSRSFASCGGAG